VDLYLHSSNTYHSYQSSAEIRNTWIYTSTPPILIIHINLVRRLGIPGSIPPLLQYVFIALCLIKHKYNFTFIITFTLLDYIKCIRDVSYQRLFDKNTQTENSNWGFNCPSHVISFIIIKLS
jgi:hypothetical protein